EPAPGAADGRRPGARKQHAAARQPLRLHAAGRHRATGMNEAPAPDLAAIAAQEMRSHGLEPEFPAAVLQEAQARGQTGPDRSGDIQDLRGRLWFSIDNVDTQDLDQLSWAEALPDGRVRLAVAVADVDAFVPRGSAVDAHAALNTTSVYTAAGVFPMLPPV